MPERIRVQALDGTWETLGVDRYPGIHPEGVAPTYNSWGPDGLSLTLRLEPALEHPNIAAFTPIDIVDGDEETWSGFTIETPGSGGDDPQLTVQALGWQYHLDDDPFRALYVATDMSEWQDVRAHPATLLGIWRAAAQNAIDASAITLTRPAKVEVSSVGTNERDPAGVFLDLGPTVRAAGVAIDYETNDVAGFDYQYGVKATNGHPGEPMLGGIDLTYFAENDAGTFPLTGTKVHDFGGLRRYIVIAGRNGGNLPETPTADAYLKITGIRVYSETSFRTGGGASDLHANNVIERSLKRLPLLDQRDDLLESTSLVLPSYSHHRTLKTAREAIEEVNAFHGWRTQIVSGRRVAFQPQASRPLLAVATGQGARFTDASTNSGRELYNKVIVTGRSGSGEPLEVERQVLHLAGSRSRRDGVPQMANPSAIASTAGWSDVDGLGAVARTTAAGTFHSSPAAFELIQDMLPMETVAHIRTDQVTGLKPGALYVFLARVRRRADVADGGRIYVYDPVAGAELGYTTAIDGGPDSDFKLWRVPFTAPPEGTVELRFYIGPEVTGAVSSIAYVDDVYVERANHSLADRRGFTRTKTVEVGPASDEIALQALGDAYLALHATTPLKGALEITADDAVTTVVGGTPIPARHLGRYVGELILITNLIDPDTGDLGRVGKIAGVTRSGQGASLTIDNERDGFERLLSRMAVITG